MHEKVLAVKGNDLSDRPLPRVAVVWEGLLGFLPQAHSRDFEHLMSQHRYADAVDLWELNDFLCRIIWDRVWKYDLKVDVVTFLGPDEFAHAIADRLGDEELPVNQVWASEPARLARDINLMPDLQRVYTHNPAHQLLFSPGVAVLLEDENNLGRI